MLETYRHIDYGQGALGALPAIGPADGGQCEQMECDKGGHGIAGQAKEVLGASAGEGHRFAANANTK